MKIAILQPKTFIENWFRQTHPEIVICEVADDEFMSADCLMIQASYEIDGEHYQILDLWRKYLEIRKKRKKLLVLGSSPYPSPNLILRNKLSDSLLNQAKKAQIARKKPLYPDLPNKDILPALERILKSHGERAFHQLLIQVQRPLRAVEQSLQKLSRAEELSSHPAMEESNFLMDQIYTVWNVRKSYFSLMPHYSDLSRFDNLWKQWIAIRDSRDIPTPKLSVQIGSFAEEVITDVTDFYKMDQLS